MLTARPPSSAGLRGLPWFSFGLVGIALAASFAPGAATLLQYERPGVGNGEAWRLLTGQLVHWTPRMALVDLGVVLLLGTLVERRNRTLLVVACLAGHLAIGLGIHLMAPQVTVFRGASGLATTLFVLLALILTGGRESLRMRRLALLALGLFFAKLLWESSHPGGLAAGPFPEGVVVLPLAHMLGGLVAVALFGVYPASCSQRERMS